jgi:PHP family Zn ribbon phosphoesterase
VLLETPKEDLLKTNIDPKLAEIIIRNREGKIHVNPGYDGVYGVPALEEGKQEEPQKEFDPKQKTLFSF